MIIIIKTPTHVKVFVYGINLQLSVLKFCWILIVSPIVQIDRQSFRRSFSLHTHHANHPKCPITIIIDNIISIYYGCNAMFFQHVIFWREATMKQSIVISYCISGIAFAKYIQQIAYLEPVSDDKNLIPKLFVSYYIKNMINSASFLKNNLITFIPIYLPTRIIGAYQIIRYTHCKHCNSATP